MPFADLLRRANLRLVTGSGKSEATFGNPKPKFSTHSFGCHFVEVTWQPEIARLRVSRVVTVIDAGRILNPLAGRNQIEGAVVMGIGMALFEHTTYDPQNGAPICCKTLWYASFLSSHSQTTATTLIADGVGSLLPSTGRAVGKPEIRHSSRKSRRITRTQK